MLSLFIGGVAAAQQDTPKVDGTDGDPGPSVEEVTPTEAEQRELGADEDPLAASQAKREVEAAKEEEKGKERTTGFDVYSSIRVRYREQGFEGDWQDGGSRIGVELDWQFRPGSFLLGRYESGFNVLTGLEDLSWFKPFDLNLQIQYGNPIPFGGGVDYDFAGALSAVLTTRNNLAVGLAYNEANIDIDANPQLRAIGLSGNARAALIGARAFGERWYAGLTMARLNNHETTDDGFYFDGWGAEFYGQYQLDSHWWFIGGVNVLEPDSDERLARGYRVRYGVLGLRYAFDEFRRMIFANVQLEDSRNADGTPQANRYTIGVRWDLSKKGWHAKGGG